MSGLAKLFEQEIPDQTLTAEVAERVSGSRYLVTIGNTNVAVISTLTSTLVRGAKVIVAKTSQGYFIVAEAGTRGQVLKEVATDG